MKIMNNSVKINMTEDDIQVLMDMVQSLEEGENEDVFTWNYEDSNGKLIIVEISVGEDPE